MHRKKENYKIFGIVEVDILKLMEMKEKTRKEYLGRRRKIIKTKVCSRNLIKGINTLAVSLCKILGTILKIDKGGTQTNGPKDQEIDNYAQDFIFLRSHRQTVWTHEHCGLQRDTNTRTQGL